MKLTAELGNEERLRKSDKKEVRAVAVCSVSDPCYMSLQTTLEIC